MDPSVSRASLLTAFKQPLPQGGVSKRQHCSDSEQPTCVETTTPGSIGQRDYTGTLQHKPSKPFDATHDAPYKTPA
ncbi:hypothetical protein FBU31_002970, partial [Coemansia sp. 'formosensis']